MPYPTRMPIPFTMASIISAPRLGRRICTASRHMAIKRTDKAELSLDFNSKRHRGGGHKDPAHGTHQTGEKIPTQIRNFQHHAFINRPSHSRKSSARYHQAGSLSAARNNKHLCPRKSVHLSRSDRKHRNDHVRPVGRDIRHSPES